MASSDSQTYNSKYFYLHTVGEGVYAAITIPRAGAWGNAGIVDLGDRTLVFDTFLTPRAARDLRAAAEHLTGHSVAYVVNSHYHMDHIQGNQVFDDARIIATERTREILANRGAALVSQVKAHPEYPDSFDELITQERDEAKQRDLAITQNEYRVLNEDRAELELRLPDITFERRLTLHGSWRTVELLSHGGGHTPSDAFLYLPAERIVFMGDLVSVRTHPSFFGDANAWLSMLDQVAQLDIQTLIPGHGDVGSWDNVGIVRQYIADLKALAEKSIQSGKSAAEVAAIPIPGAYAQWDAPTVFADNMKYLYEHTVATHE